MKSNKKTEIIVTKVSKKKSKEIERAAKRFFDGNVSELIRRSIDLMLSNGRSDAGINIRNR